MKHRATLGLSILLLATGCIAASEPPVDAASPDAAPAAPVDSAPPDSAEPAPTPAPLANDPDLAEELRRLAAEYEVPAMGAATLRPGAPPRGAVVGNRRVGEADPARSSDAWHLGSNGKAMTAAAIYLAAEAGLLGTQATLSEVFPTVGVHPDHASTTLYDLLVHRGGLPDNDELPAAALAALRAGGASPTLRAGLVEAILEAPPAVDPSRTRYSNYAYVTAGTALETRHPGTFEEILERTLFDRLGLGSCGFGPPSGESGALSGHLTTAAGLRPDAGDNPAWASPTGGVHCSLLDWVRFIGWMTGAAPTDAPRALLAALAEPVVGRVPGWEVVAQPWASTPILVHLGTNGRWFSTAWVVPAEGRVYVATSNSGAREANEAINAAIAWMVRRDSDT